MHVQPYLNFDGKTEEAVEFYKKAVGAKVELLMRFKEAPLPHPPGMIPPGAENKVMHVSFRIGESRILASDGHCTGHAKFEGINLTLYAANAVEAGKYFAALSEGGKVLMSLTKTFFSESFGMTADRFGIMWMVMVEK